MSKCPQTAADLPTDPAEILKLIYRRLIGTMDYHAILTQDGETSLGEWLQTVIQSFDHAPHDLVPKLSTFACFKHRPDFPFRAMIQGPDGFEYFADGNSMNDLITRFLESSYVVNSSAIASAIRERIRQNEKWGEQNHDLCTWSTILTEECGEFAEASLHDKFGGHAADGVRNEAVQVAAVALQIVEFLDRTRLGKYLD